MSQHEMTAEKTSYSVWHIRWEKPRRGRLEDDAEQVFSPKDSQELREG